MHGILALPIAFPATDAQVQDFCGGPLGKSPMLVLDMAKDAKSNTYLDAIYTGVQFDGVVEQCVETHGNSDNGISPSPSPSPSTTPTAEPRIAPKLGTATPKPNHGSKPAKANKRGSKGAGKGVKGKGNSANGRGTPGNGGAATGGTGSGESRLSGDNSKNDQYVLAPVSEEYSGTYRRAYYRNFIAGVQASAAYSSSPWVTKYKSWLLFPLALLGSFAHETEDYNGTVYCAAVDLVNKHLVHLLNEGKISSMGPPWTEVPRQQATVPAAGASPLPAQPPPTLPPLSPTIPPSPTPTPRNLTPNCGGPGAFGAAPMNI